MWSFLKQGLPTDFAFLAEAHTERRWGKGCGSAISRSWGLSRTRLPGSTALLSLRDTALPSLCESQFKMSGERKRQEVKESLCKTRHQEKKENQAGENRKGLQKYQKVVKRMGTAVMQERAGWVKAVDNTTKSIPPQMVWRLHPKALLLNIPPCNRLSFLWIVWALCPAPAGMLEAGLSASAPTTCCRGPL